MIICSSMAVEIDQSGRVEDLSTGTAVAFSNKQQGSLFISAGAKRKLISYLRRNSLIPVSDLPAVIFGILLYMLISDYKIDNLRIDEEYTGKNLIIEETIEKLFIGHAPARILTIRFMRIGKKSRAHILAWQVHRSKGRGKEVKKVSETDILKLI